MSLNKDISNTWIKNIRNLDEKNKLKHGEIYAKDGSVRNFTITNNKVNAEVCGALDESYNVEIEFLKFSNQDIENLKKFILKNPILYSYLLNNEIPIKMFDINVKIFPDSLKDFKMDCSCDKGLFCKHKAAVFHKIKDMISKDPFLIFSLKGFNISDLIYNDSQEIKTINNVLNNDEEINFKYSQHVNYLDKLFYSLSDFPSFFPSQSVNFNQLMHDTLKAMSRCCYQIQNAKLEKMYKEYIILSNSFHSFDFYSAKSLNELNQIFNDKWGNPENWAEFKLNIDGNYNIIKINTDGINNFLRSDLKLPLFAFFAELSQIDFTSYCEDIKFLHEVYIFTSKLIYSNALIPEFFRLDNGEYHVRWIPCFEKEIYDQLDELCDNYSGNILTFNNSKLSIKNQVIALISLFFEGFSDYYHNKCISHNLSVFKNETFYRLFFIKSQDFSNYIYKGKELEIDNWLSVLYLNQKDYELILNTTQVDSKFQLDLKIKLNNELYNYNQIVALNRLDIIRNLVIIKNIFLRFGIEYDFSKIDGMNIRDYSFFYYEIAVMLMHCGIVVNAPIEFLNSKEAKLVLDYKSEDIPTYLTIDDLVDFDWQVAVGDTKFSIDDFKSISLDFRGLVNIDDKYYRIDKDNLSMIQDKISKIPKVLDNSSMISYLLSSDSDDVVINNKLLKLFDDILNVSEISVPTSLNGKLREYQETGFSWLVQNLKVGFGSILADDMGLGKTIQLLTLILYLKENNQLNNAKVLIVVPTSILTNWTMEIEKFAPSLKVEVYHGTGRKLPVNNFDILLTSYGMVRRDFEILNSINWFLFVIDEAQNIKNPKSKQTKAVKSINAQYHIALSGTPVENHLTDYWSIFDFTNKGYLKSLREFKNKFINPIEKEKNNEILQDFKHITSPFILRRLKTEKNIIKELPDKIVNDSMYNETLNLLLGDVEDSEGIQRKGLVFKLINSLKQICNHPSQFLKIDEAKITESGKMEVLMNILENILESDEKVLIFTQYVKMGNIMKDLIKEKFNEEVLFLSGEVPRKKRDEMINEFQNGKTKIFILSLKAGGIGLNLTAAVNVIHYDLWWNPAVENQATDRAYRIGQTENVMVYRFITKGTLEEKINQILLEKRELVDMTVGSETSFITEMSNDELRELLDLRNIS